MQSMRIAVVGGGSVATSFLFHLVRARVQAQSALPRLQVLVFEPAPAVGRGAAYADDAPTNLLNVTAGSMSVAEDDRQHFLRWLHRQAITNFQGEQITHDSFLPRPLFGRYLEDVYRETCATGATLGVDIRHVREAVHDVRADPPAGYRLVTQQAEHIAQRVILAIGNLSSAAFEDLRGHAGYFDSPYPVRALACGIPRDAVVCVLGTSLSAIDAVVALAEAGHTGPMYCMSRNGRLPSVRGLKNQPVTLSPRLVATLAEGVAQGRRLTLREAMGLLADELAHQGIAFDELLDLQAAPPPATDYLQEEITLSSSRPRQWQSLGNALNAVVDAIWQQLDDAGRERFDTTLRSIWMARRVTFPIENARRLQALLRAGRLQVMPGLQSVAPVPGQHHRFRIQARDRAELHADVVINATSFSADARHSDLPLLRNLLDRGEACPHRFGGLCVDFATGNLMRSDGSINADISVLGTMAAGTYFWTNSMDVNARLARGVAGRLVQELCASETRAERTCPI